MTNWPVYTDAARAAHREGVVLLSVKISANGTPLDVKVARSSNFADLDVAAVVAVRKWKFTPATRDGTPSETTVNLPVNFSLRAADKTPAPVIPKPAPVKPKPKVAKIVPKPKPAAGKPEIAPAPSAEEAPAEPN
jgi:TonB family protein